MEKNIEIKNINLTIEKEELQLTVEEARKLHSVLDAIFKKEVLTEYVKGRCMSLVGRLYGRGE